MKTFKTKKGTELPLMDLKGKDYLQVAHRVQWFREEHPDATISTEIVYTDDIKSTVKATVLGTTAHQTEYAKSFADHLAKCETAAIGRALALCGYGTQFATDLDMGDRLADAPLEPKTRSDYSPIKEGYKPNLGVRDEDFVVPYGKNKGTKVGQLDTLQVAADAKYWRGREKEDGKPLSGLVKAYVEVCERLVSRNEFVTPSDSWAPPEDDIP